MSSRRARRLRLSSAFLTIVWLLLCWLYVASEIGWPVLSQMLPHEIGLVVTGVLAPLALLWAMTLAETRADIMAAELARQVALLLAAPSAALAGVESGADTLARRADQLTAVATESALHLERVTVRLEAALERGTELRGELAHAIELLGTQLDQASRIADVSGRHLAAWRDGLRDPAAEEAEPLPAAPPSRWRRFLAAFDIAAGG